MKKLAVIGNPIEFSQSPYIHHYFSKLTSINVEYSKIQVEESQFYQTVENFKSSHGHGMNVTVPFKLKAYQYADKHTELAQYAKAVNTLLFEPSGTTIGHNTDGLGLINDIKQNLNWQIDGKKILILGAGGAVRGIIAPLIQENPEQIYLFNRTKAKALELINDFKAIGNIDLYDKHADKINFDIIINGTSASLFDELPELPINLDVAGALCYDMVYGKTITYYCQWAMTNGAAAIADGLGMLVEQAAQSFYFWFKQLPATQPVIAALRKKLTQTL